MRRRYDARLVGAVVLVVMAGGCGARTGISVDEEPDAAVTVAPCPAECGWTCDAVGCDDAVEVASGWYHSCARTRSGRVDCWGYNPDGLLGVGSTERETYAPMRVLSIDDAIDLATGYYHSCVVRADGRVACWGFNEDGVLGDGTTASPVAPVEVSGLGDATAIAGGLSFTCALRASGRVACWGTNTYGQLGDGGVIARATPRDVPSVEDAIAIVAGGWFACALDAAGRVRCWGRDALGPVGDGPGAESTCGEDRLACTLHPVSVDDLPPAVWLRGGGEVVCAGAASGQVSCWGWDSFGQLGDGGAAAVSCGPHLCSPSPTPIAAFVGAAAMAFTAGVTCWLSDGRVRCLGADDIGQLGDGMTAHGACPLRDPRFRCALEPVDVVGLHDAVAIGGGGPFLAVRATGGVVAWGSNSNGALGDGTTETRTRPVDVIRPVR